MAYFLKTSDFVFGVNTTAMAEAAIMNNNVFSITGLPNTRQVGVEHFDLMLEKFSINTVLFSTENFKSLLLREKTKILDGSSEELNSHKEASLKILNGVNTL